jgi:hypothetical protein
MASCPTNGHEKGGFSFANFRICVSARLSRARQERWLKRRNAHCCTIAGSLHGRLGDWTLRSLGHRLRRSLAVWLIGVRG